MSSRVERLSSVTVAMAAIVAAVVLLHREFSAQPFSLNSNAKPVLIDRWRDLIPAGNWIGRPDAPVVVVEFSDFECPFCRRFDKSFRALPQSIRESVAVLFVHYPLPGHRFALPAARAAECAAEQGGFVQFHHAVYDKQDSLGLKSWQSYAADAGLNDTIAFNRCVASGRTPLNIARGTALGDSLRITGTPTVIVNGWRLSRIAYDSLAAILELYGPKASGKGSAQ